MSDKIKAQKRTVLLFFVISLLLVSISTMLYADPSHQHTVKQIDYEPKDEYSVDFNDLDQHHQENLQRQIEQINPYTTNNPTYDDLPKNQHVNKDGIYYHIETTERYTATGLGVIGTFIFGFLTIILSRNIINLYLRSKISY